jgi:two-component system response regulator PilR (NtrC family)
MKPLEGKTVMVVDDEADLRKLMGQSLRMFGAEVIEASSGNEAWKLLQQAPPGQISAIVSDVRMADGDGVELLARVQASIKPAPRMVLVTGYADVPEAEILARGAAKILAKPFRLKDVVAALTDDGASNAA